MELILLEVIIGMIKTEPEVSESTDSRSLKIEEDKDSEKFFSEGIK